MGSPVYYRVYFSRDEKVVVVTMQDFDEADYDQKRFITAEQFSTKEAAHNWIVEKQDFISAAIAASAAFGYPIFSKI